MYKKFLVVGDRFNTFSQLDGVTTFSAALERLAQRNEDHEMIAFLLGQGLSRSEEIALLDAAEAAGATETVKMISACSRCRASRSLCHKHVEANRLVSMPRRVDTQVFEADLVVDDDNEIMSDHLTGQHLQGMLLVEAARQMFITVGEAFYAVHEQFDHAYYVIYDMNTRFQAFGFPVATLIRQTISDIARPRPGRMDMTVKIEFMQGDTQITTIDVTFGIFESAQMIAKENRLAGELVKSLLHVEEDMLELREAV